MSNQKIVRDKNRYLESYLRYVPNSGITKELAKNVVRIDHADIPNDVIKLAKLAMLDAAGNMLNGALQSSSQKILSYVRKIGGTPDATCIFYGDKTNIYNAALVNGSFCHGAIESVTIPATLAINEKEFLNGYELITAIVLGWEVSLRLAISAPIIPSKRPLDPISTFGPFGAAVASGRILRLNEFDMENALSCCTAQSAGALHSNQVKGESERVVSGFAASYGLRASNWAKQGISGAREILEGKAGFFMCIAGLNDDGTPKFKVEKINEKFGEKWHIQNMKSKISVDLIEKKFREWATTGGISKVNQDEVIEFVNNIEDQDDIQQFVSNLVPISKVK
jgi:2-methylcitrate dehydratase PrpD